MGLDMRELRIMLFGVKGFQQNRAVNGRARKGLKMLINRQLGEGWNHWKNLLEQKRGNEDKAAEAGAYTPSLLSST